MPSSRETSPTPQSPVLAQGGTLHPSFPLRTLPESASVTPVALSVLSPVCCASIQSPENICTLFDFLFHSLHPQDSFGLSGPFGTSLILVTMPLVLSEPLPKPPLCSTAVCFLSYSMFLCGIWYPKMSLVGSDLEFFREGDSLHLFLSIQLPQCFFCHVLQFTFVVAT